MEKKNDKIWSGKKGREPMESNKRQNRRELVRGRQMVDNSDEKKKKGDKLETENQKRNSN
jgi:hypothetical protein